MTYLYATLIVLVLALVVINSYRTWFVNKARKQGKLPVKGKVTMFDVRNLLMEGKKDLAIQVYAEIFKTNLVKAKHDVEELQRSLKV